MYDTRKSSLSWIFAIGIFAHRDFHPRRTRNTKQNTVAEQTNENLLYSHSYSSSVECWCQWVSVQYVWNIFQPVLFVINISKSQIRWIKWLLTLGWNFGTIFFFSILFTFNGKVERGTFSDEMIKLECACHKRRSLMSHVRGIWMSFYTPFTRTHAFYAYFMYILIWNFP